MYAQNPTPTLQINPPWMDCTAIQAGEPPDKFNRDCYNDAVSARVGPDGIASLISNCPMGYTGATSYTYPPFYRPVSDSGTRTTRTEAADVVVTQVYCCPSISGMSFRYNVGEAPSTATVVDGTTWSGDLYLMPRCQATRVQALQGQTVTLTPYSDTMAWERRRQAETDSPSGLITEVWNDANTVYAAYDYYDVTVFADGYSCFGNCTDYWLNSYTSPESSVVSTVPDQTTTTTSSPTTTDGLAGLATATATTSSTSGAHCVARGSGWARAGVLLVTTVVAASLIL
jgi:hypothetical protein